MVGTNKKGEGGKTPGCRLTVGRLHVLKSFPTARPLPASPQPSLHPPSPCFGQCTNITNTCMLCSATLGSTYRRWSHLQRVDGFARAETTCLRATHSCCDIHCSALLLTMWCAIIWLKLVAQPTTLRVCCIPMLQHSLLCAVVVNAVPLTAQVFLRPS